MRWLLPLLLLSACTRALDTPIQQVSCEQLSDEKSCLAAGCAVVSICECPGSSDEGFPGCTEKTAALPVYCSAGCGMAEPSCESLTTADVCDARSDCWALLTFDETCGDVDCGSHFESCRSGSPTCDAPSCPEPSDVACAAGAELVYEPGKCAIGCVAADRCSQ